MYNVSKAASIQLNTLLAQELRRPGVKVRVNSIAPGIFPSEMTGERWSVLRFRCVSTHVHLQPTDRMR